MQNILKTTTLFSICAILLTLSACTKNQASQPANPNTNDFVSDLIVQDEATLRQPSPGTYMIARFIDTGDDETSQFNGYTFEFKSNGVLIATTNTGQKFTGSWQLNSTETMMEISISGNAALNDLDDDDWKVRQITNNRIILSAPGPDVVAFVKI